MELTGSEQEIFTRGDATFAVSSTLKAGASAYEWGEMSVADFGAKMTAARAARGVESAKKAAFDAQRGLVNARFDDLESLKTQGIGMAKYRFRQDEAVISMVESVGEYGEGRESTLKEADEWSAAWGNIDPDYTPTPTNTLAIFNALRADCEAQLKILTRLKSDYRKAGIELGALLAEIEDIYNAWYGEATRAFPVGTVEGDLMRSQIPTFQTPAAKVVTARTP